MTSLSLIAPFCTAALKDDMLRFADNFPEKLFSIFNFRDGKRPKVFVYSINLEIRNVF